MNFSKQLKYYRELHQLSQENLAEKIYVTRQTISKWENDRSYPDIHNLVALSVLFDISLDELVRGDVKKMKDEVAKTKWNFWTISMAILLIIAPFSLGPAFKLWRFNGLWLTVLLTIFLVISCLQVVRLNKVNNLKAYSDILTFLELEHQSSSEKPKHSSSLNEATTSLLTVIIFISFLVLGFLLFY